jgi:SulP family sulfate permease
MAPGVVAYRLYGALFFAATAKLEALPEALPPGTSTLVLDGRQLVSIDASGLDALENLHRTLARANVRLVLVGLNEQPREAIRKWGLDTILGERNLFADRDSAFADLVGAEAQ